MQKWYKSLSLEVPMAIVYSLEEDDRTAQEALSELIATSCPDIESLKTTSVFSEGFSAWATAQEGICAQGWDVQGR